MLLKYIQYLDWKIPKEESFVINSRRWENNITMDLK
jgi:hypothetical protein